ncbi:helix-turn-helix domain-containing protein [Pseudonocardia ailaonensis]|uniref:Helix-turn-helix domain-containing protein n=1 Tax=Pseudonocardia ailaonensis TaxID=367279 RepID=A0ABN2NKY4_9PSEU
MAIVTIDTSGVGEPDRLDFWRSTVCDQFVDLDVTPTAGRLVDGRISAADIGGTHIRRIASGPHTFTRTSRQVRAADEDYLQIALARRGRTLIVQDGREAVIRPGEFVLYDSSRPFTFATTDDFEYSVCLHPKRSLGLTETEIAAVTAIRFDGRRGVGAMVPPMLSALHRTVDEGMTPATVEALERTVGDLFGVLVRSHVPARSPAGVHLDRARAFLREHLADRELNPAAVAHGCAISVSYLHRLFAEAGTSVGATIREERLLRCRADLVRPELAHVAVGAIGARWGLPDPARFSRAFRARFGCSPSGYRAQATGQLSSVRRSAGSMSGDGSVT